jgi:DNA invertase Pin-like site-specific DNA recombinase
VGLVRVSKVGTRGDDLLSPELQRTAITGYADQRGVEIVRWVEALDESGSQSRSPWWRRFDAQVEAVEAGEIDGILVWRYSRAARHRRKWAVALDRVESVGGFLESATEQVDTTTSTGRLARGMLAEMAAWESDVKGEQWKEVHASRLSRGLPATGKPRFGYTYDRAAGFEPDPELAPLVHEVYRRFVEGDTVATLGKWLFEQGVRTTNGRAWTPSNLQRYLDGGFAAGVILHNGVEYPGAHEPIITAQEWAAYRRVRETTRRQAPRTRAAAHPMAGLVRCGVCGGPSCRSVQPRPEGGKRWLFVCCQRKAMGKTTCTGPSAAETRVHAAVKEWLVEVSSDVDKRASAIAEQKARAGRVRVDAGKAAREVASLDQAIASLAVQAAQGLLPASAHALAVDDLLQQRERAEARQRAAEQDAVYLAAPAAATARTLLGSWDELVEVDPKGLRDVLSALISRVEIHPAPEGERHTVITVVPRWRG